jgi:hypothetical protein
MYNQLGVICVYTLSAMLYLSKEKSEMVNMYNMYL